MATKVDPRTRKVLATPAGQSLITQAMNGQKPSGQSLLALDKLKVLSKPVKG